MDNFQPNNKLYRPLTLKTLKSDSTFIVPPNNELWIPPNTEHATTLLAHAELFSVYLTPHEETNFELKSPDVWHQCQAFEVSPLLHELIVKLSENTEEDCFNKEYLAICTLIWVELRQARPLSLVTCHLALYFQKKKD